MKKIILSTALVMMATVGSANAALFIEEYTGFQGVYENQSYNFGFDMWEANTVFDVTTDSALTLKQDAEGAFGSWDSVKLIVDLWSEDSAWERAQFKFTAYNDIGLDPDAEVWLGALAFNGEDDGLTIQTAQFNYDFNDAQLASFEEWGWGNVRIKAVSYGAIDNDFAIERVAMAVNTAPVPEPSTILLFGAGLAGLVGYSRKRSNKKA